jgi:3-oxoacyl-[acyl-carrier protein] reductase
MSFSLKGRVAWVTGSTTGLGKAIALELGKAGAKVALNYNNNKERAEKTFADYKAAGCTGILTRGDVSNADEIGRMYREINEQLGPIDILVPNATPDQPHKAIEDYDWAFYQSMLDFFIKSPFLLTRACLPSMKKKKYGRIINIGSEVFKRGVGNFSGYVAAKGGQDGWSRSMATELAPFGITVNVVAPGWIPVERHEKEPQSEKDSYLSLIPVGHWGVPRDIGSAVTFLASDEAAFITGQSLHVNGGMTVG